MNTTTRLTSIEYVMGDPRPIREIPELAADDGLLETLLALGLESYCTSTRPTIQLAQQAASQTLENSNIARDEIGLLVYATSFPEGETGTLPDLGRLCSELQMHNAAAQGVFGWECANLFLAWQTAVNWVASGDTEHALVVTADRCWRGSRLVPPGMSVLSDGACAGIVTRSELHAGWRLQSIAHQANPSMSAVSSSGDAAAYLAGVGKGVRLAAQKAMKDLQYTPSDIGTVCMNNYNLSLLRTFCRSLEVDPRLAFRKNIDRFGHCWAADAWINLKDAQGIQPSSQSTLLLGSGPSHWGAAVVKETD